MSFANFSTISPPTHPGYATSLRISWAMEAIRGRRQMAVVALFGQLGFQHVDAFAQLRHLVSQDGILLSELFQFFVFAHASTLLACSLLCKPLVLRVSYTYSFSSNSPFCRQKPTQEPANGIPKAR